MNDNSCPICKEKSAIIDIVPATLLPLTVAPGTGRSPVNQVRFHVAEVETAALELLRFPCPLETGCGHFRSLGDLQTHLKRDHKTQYCELCLSHRQAFLAEQTLYDEPALRSHETTSHPACEFCLKSYASRHFTEDELRDHLRKNHFLCSVCDELNWKNEWFADYAALNAHFAEAHFPCPHADCLENRFVVFPDEDGLHIHQLEVHTSGNRRQLLTIALQGGRAPATSGTATASSPSFSAPKKKQQLRTVLSTSELAKINFRGPRRAGAAHLGAAVGALLEGRYPADLRGVVYDPNAHQSRARKVNAANAQNAAVAPPSPPGRRRVAAPLPKRLAEALQMLRQAGAPADSTEYDAANRRLAQLLETAVGERKMAAFKQQSREFKTGGSAVAEYAEQLTSFVNEESTSLSVNLLVELLRLCPRRKELVGELAESTESPGRKPGDSVVFQELVDAEIVTGGKLSFLNALHAVCLGQGGVSGGQDDKAELTGHRNRLVQLIGTLDAIQLETLAELRNQLLNVNGRLSLKNVDALIGLRPLFYRLMHVPEDRTKDATQLMAFGWREFTATATDTIRAHFDRQELFYVDLYVKLANAKLKSMGDRALVSARHDFPHLASSSQPANSYRKPLPAVDAFQPSLPSSASATPAPTARLWRRRGETPVEPDNFPVLADAFGFPVAPAPAAAPAAATDAAELRVKKRGKTVLLSTQPRRQ